MMFRPPRIPASRLLLFLLDELKALIGIQMHRFLSAPGMESCQMVPVYCSYATLLRFTVKSKVLCQRFEIKLSLSLYINPEVSFKL